ncbi:MAG: hypothetical protein GF411_05090 [Candidatus Lokiarchaeota archaeon]|nr:hypothetical protein [Candidatus Lokiarchaeota archaeon]
MIVARFIDTPGTHVYRFSYQNGSLSESILHEHIENNTLTLIVPLSRLLPSAFIVVLEAAADVGLEQDLTSPDRDHPVVSLATFLGI